MCLGCCLLRRLLLWAEALLWGSPRRVLGPFFLSLSCTANCKCQRRGLTCDSKVLRPKKLLLSAKGKSCTEFYRWEESERQAPLSLTVIRRGVLSARTQRNKALCLSYLGLECGKASLHLRQLGASSQLKLPLRFGVYKSGVSFGFIDPGHGTKQ